MFVPLTSRKQLMDAIKLDLESPHHQDKSLQCPYGTVSCRLRGGGAFLFQTGLFSVGDQLFSNGDGRGFFFKYQPKVDVEFRGEHVVGIKVNVVDVDLDSVELHIKC